MASAGSARQLGDHFLVPGQLPDALAPRGGVAGQEIQPAAFLVGGRLVAPRGEVGRPRRACRPQAPSAVPAGQRDGFRPLHGHERVLAVAVKAQGSTSTSPPPAAGHRRPRGRGRGRTGPRAGPAGCRRREMAGAAAAPREWEWLVGAFPTAGGRAPRYSKRRRSRPLISVAARCSQPSSATLGPVRPGDVVEGSEDVRPRVSSLSASSSAPAYTGRASASRPASSSVRPERADSWTRSLSSSARLALHRARRRRGNPPGGSGDPPSRCRATAWPTGGKR